MLNNDLQIYEKGTNIYMYIPTCDCHWPYNYRDYFLFVYIDFMSHLVIIYMQWNYSYTSYWIIFISSGISLLLINNVLEHSDLIKFDIIVEQNVPFLIFIFSFNIFCLCSFQTLFVISSSSTKTPTSSSVLKMVMHNIVQFMR